MYEVVVNVSQPVELNDFFEATKRFGKKAYTHRAEVFGEEQGEACGSEGRIMIEAAGISRDVTYLLRMDVYAERLMPEELYDELKREHSPDECRYPLFNLVPARGELLDALYPYHGDGEWRTSFGWNGYTLVSDIRRDGGPILRPAEAS